MSPGGIAGAYFEETRLKMLKLLQSLGRWVSFILSLYGQIPQTEWVEGRLSGKIIRKRKVSFDNFRWQLQFALEDDEGLTHVVCVGCFTDAMLAEEGDWLEIHYEENLERFRRIHSVRVTPGKAKNVPPVRIQ